ncbi:MAG: hypothetical protein ACJA19_000224 [Bacteroidia bacterium]|jgi:hypothetical protein
MKNKFKSTVLFILLSILPHLAFSQTLILGALSDFEAYSGSGAITGPGTTGSITGDIGTNGGVVSGFGASYTGTQHNNDSLTAQARIDILRVYIHLSDIFVTDANTHAAAFGGGDTLTAGVYSIATAGSIGGTLTLDGEGDTNAVFIVKFEGALTMGAGTTISLCGGARACNVFWIAEGAISSGAGCTIQGTLFSHGGAITLSAGCDLEGRMLTSAGAITFGIGTDAIIPTGSVAVVIKCLNDCNPSSAVDVLGTISNFGLFTSSGAVTNTASSGIIGDIGTNFGSISGFLTSTQVGLTYTADSVTQQAKLDLDSAYLDLIALPLTDSTHGAAYGSVLGDTITPGVYYNLAAGAGSLAGTILLDGQGNSNSIFVIRFNGALTVAAKTKVILIDGAQRCNIFWISEGATSIGTFVSMKGSVIANGGACTIGPNGNLEGRMLSTVGAIGFSAGVVYNNTLCFSPPVVALPVRLLSFTAEINNGHVQLNWVTASEINNDYFTIQHSTDGVIFTSVNKIRGAGNSMHTLNYSSIHHPTIDGISYYRLKQTDYDGQTSYSKIVAVDFNTSDFIIAIYPNPFSKEITFRTNMNLKNANLIVYNSHKMVRQIENMTGTIFTFKRGNLPNGLYWIKLIEDKEVIAIKKIVITE